MKMQEEIWKEVVGYEGLYLISNQGRVKSITRRIKNNLGWISKRAGRDITVRLDSFGYFDTRLCKDGAKKSAFIHRLIAEAFIPNSENKRIVNHINGVKTDNRIENLEWVTGSENMKHAVSINLVCPFCKKKVVDNCTGQEYASIKQAAVALHLPYRDLKAILHQDNGAGNCLELAA